MSTSLLFLLAAITLSVIGSFVVARLHARTERRQLDEIDVTRHLMANGRERVDPPSGITVIEPAPEQD